MKSAYELAMERLNQADPSPSNSLTDEQKQQLADIDQKYKAKIAEKEVFLSRPLQEARSQGAREEEAQLLKQLSLEKERLQEEMEAEKAKVREAGNGSADEKS